MPGEDAMYALLSQFVSSLEGIADETTVDPCTPLAAMYKLSPKEKHCLNKGYHNL